MAQDARTILFSGGGTVGHLAPGFALAEVLEGRGVRCVFATPGEAVERDWFEGRPSPVTLRAVRLPRRPLAMLRFPFRFRACARAARAHLEVTRPDAVVALGGWPCAPAAWAARGARVPLAFLVPDAVPGLVVRKLAGRAARIYLADARARDALGGHPGLVVSGPLLRRGALDVRRDPAAFGLAAARRTLFVTGGSLGAQRLYERFLEGLARAVEADAGLAARIQVLHAVGKHGRADETAAVYDRLGIRHAVVPFVHDMGAAYGSADLLLCRAGANTCAELRATATPAVLVPYPHHADRQQFHNAEALVAAGGAVLVEQETLDPAAVATQVLGLLEDEARLARMRAALAGDAVDGATAVADDLGRFLGWAP